MFGIKREYLVIAAVALGAYAAVALVQRNIVKVPVVGGYLPS